MSTGRKILGGMSGVVLSAILVSQLSMTVMAAGNNKSYMDSLNVGVATIIDPGAYFASVDKGSASASGSRKAYAQTSPAKQQSEEKEAASTLVMANVKSALNVRAEADEDSDVVGKLYKDCGGRIVEREDGWTKLKSGNMVGWAKDEYLLFEEDAEALAGEVGNLIVTIETDALRVRQEPSTEAGVYGLIAQDDEMEVIEVIDDNWISVDFEGKTGYVSSEFVNTDFHIDEGESIQEIKAREKAEAEAKAKLKTNYGAVAADTDDTRLLAALIQCEAGGESYEGKLAVGAVVMNRVRSGAYPGTISGVIYASGQFTPALNGKVARVYSGSIKDSCIQAAQEAINGATNVGEATHFKRVGAHDGYVIGNHVFW